MKLNELLLEIGDQPYPWKWITRPSNKIESMAKFMDGDDVISVNILKDIKDDVILEWTRNSYSKKISINSNQIRTFSTIIEIIKNYVNVMHPARIKFSSYKKHDKIDKRLNLYNRLIKKFANDNGYELTSVNKDTDSLTFIILTRIKNENK
jgi:lysyl-tRNA synthetase class I